MLALNLGCTSKTLPMSTTATRVPEAVRVCWASALLEKPATIISETNAKRETFMTCSTPFYKEFSEQRDAGHCEPAGSSCSTGDPAALPMLMCVHTLVSCVWEWSNRRLPFQALHMPNRDCRYIFRRIAALNRDFSMISRSRIMAAPMNRSGRFPRSCKMCL